MAISNELGCEATATCSTSNKSASVIDMPFSDLCGRTEIRSAEPIDGIYQVALGGLKSNLRLC